MSEGLDPAEEQQIIQQLARLVASEIARGGNREAIVRELVKQGVPEHSAHEFVADIGLVVDDVRAAPEDQSPAARAAQARVQAQAQRIGRGLILAVLGLLIALAAFLAIPNLPGITLVVFLLPVFYGGFEFISGLRAWQGFGR